jgi:TonB family protein
MTNFKQALGKFLNGEIEFSQLEAALVADLAGHPKFGTEALQILNSLYSSGRLPLQLHQALLQKLQVHHQSPQAPSNEAPPAPGSDDDDKTRFVIPPQATPAPPPVSSGHQTDVETGESQATGQTGETGQSGNPRSTWSNSGSWPETNTGAPMTGSILKGRFVLESIIGQGGMGVVFKAKDLRKEEAQDRNPYLAVKILNEKFKQHPESLKALQRESRKAQQLAHPNVVNVFDFDRDAGNVFMTMEYMEGEPLDRFMKRNISLGISLSEAMPMIRDMGHGLSYAHDRGIIHADFKPANAFLTTEGVVKVFDFGIARAAQRSDQAAGEMTLFDAGTLGALTPAYATIGMIEGDEPDQRDDIYALACVVYELLSGRHPFRKKSALKAKNSGLVAAPIDGLDRRQWRTLKGALSFDRSKQPATVKEFIDGLEAQETNKMQWVAGGIAVLLLIAFLLGTVPSYLRDWHLNSLMKTLQSGSDSKIELIFDELENDLSPEEQSIVYRNNAPSTVALFDYFNRGIAASIGTDNDNSRQLDLYDYPAALELIVHAEDLFPDSAAVSRINNIEERREAEIEHQKERFERALENQILLSSQGPDSAEEILGVVALVQTGHELLTDQRLVNAFERQVRTALANDDIDLARSLLDGGIKVMPTAQSLLNLGSEVDNAMAFAESTGKERADAAIQAMLENIRQLARTGQFSPPNENVADRKLLELQGSGAGPATIELAKEAIALGYLRLAGIAREAGNFESARSLTELITRPSANVSERRQQELAYIDMAEQSASRAASAPPTQRSEPASLGEIKLLEQQFIAGISKSNLTLEDGRELVDIVDELQQLGAKGDIVDNGRDRIGAALLQWALVRADAGAWGEALGIAVGTRELLPESNSARTVSEMLERDYQRFREKPGAQQEPAEDRLNQLMAQSIINLVWLDEILQVRDEMGGDAVIEQSLNEQIELKLAQQIDQHSRNEEFSDARELFDAGSALWPASAALIAAGNGLRSAIDASDFQAQRREQGESGIAAIPATVAVSNSKSGVENRAYKITHFVPPEYPLRAEEMGITGWVDIAYTITKNGDTTNIQVVKSEPETTFDSAATEAVEQWRYDPVIENYEAVDKRFTIRLNFYLD